MKRFILVVGLMLGTACPPSPENCQSGSTCSKGGTWSACCTATQCHYKTSDGADFPCKGTDCSSGNPSPAAQVASWCLSH